MPKNSVTVTELLSTGARTFLEKLHRAFETKRQQILAARGTNENSIESVLERSQDDGREKDRRRNVWTVAEIPPALVDRTVEITGPAEPKMIINALNSGANVFMADFEDSLSPTWNNVLEGHVALQAALRRELQFQNEQGKVYRLAPDESKIATLIVRPRGWHLNEPRFDVDGRPMSASLFDFGLYLFHGGKLGLETGRGPYYYLPKMESPLEARLWSEVFRFSEIELGLPVKSVRVTALIETLPAALMMEDILFELRDYIVGLNAGRWDYLFSMIKSLAGTRFEMTFPDRGRLTMEVPFMRRYAEKIVAVCERRHAYPMGGMSALIPQRKDIEKNERALAMVRTDKEREAKQGFKGTWVAHPDLVQVAREAFKNATRDPNSAGREPRAADLLPRPSEEPFMSHQPTLAGVSINIDVALRYIFHWLNGLGAVAIHGLMEDAATAEISRAQLWQWRKNAVVLENGERVTSEWLVSAIRRASQELLNAKEESLSIAASELKKAEVLLVELVEQSTFTPFLTLPAMDRLKSNNDPAKNFATYGDTNAHDRI